MKMINKNKLEITSITHNGVTINTGLKRMEDNSIMFYSGDLLLRVADNKTLSIHTTVSIACTDYLRIYTNSACSDVFLYHVHYVDKNAINDFMSKSYIGDL